MGISDGVTQSVSLIFPLNPPFSEGEICRHFDLQYPKGVSS